MSNNLPNKSKVLIVGGGLTGLSAAYHLQNDYILTESTNQVGGSAGSIEHKGFKLDHAVHILYFKHKSTKELIKNELEVELIERDRSSMVWIFNRLVPFPIQLNLAFLPLKERIIMGLQMLAAIAKKSEKADTFMMSDWAQNSFGKQLTKTFFQPYNEKLWGAKLNEMTTEWMGDYLPKTPLQQLLQGLLSKKSFEYGRNSFFSYPKEGGISSVSKGFAKKIKNLFLEKTVVQIDANNKTALFNTGETVEYDYLITSMPLKSLLPIIKSDKISFAEDLPKLRANSVSIVHLLIPRENIGDGLHWMYVPDYDIPFYRITFPHFINEANVPKGYSVLTLEFGHKVTDREAMKQQSIDSLIKMNLLRSSDMGIESVWNDFEYGYVTYTREITDLRKRIIAQLNDFNIFSVGRYGNWEYSNMESAILMGKKAAEEVLSKMEESQNA